MKKLAVLFLLALSIPLSAQVMCQPKNDVLVEAFPVTQVYVCEKDSVIWTTMLQIGDDGNQLIVNYNGSLGNFSWSEPVRVSLKPVVYKGCANGGLVCWKFRQTNAVLGLDLAYLDGSFSVH